MVHEQNILVTGANGQLGNELRVLANTTPSFNFFFTDTHELDITDHFAIEKYFLENKIHACINCAAYTAVDDAENDKELAFKINATAVEYLATVCNKYNAWLIHISTDYVFNGNATSPYKEEDHTDPINYYGLTKLEGEKSALKYNPQSIIIRTSWLYSIYGKNFVKTMIRFMNEKDNINVVNDQFGSPTYAADLAAAIIHILENKQMAAGTYHYCNQGIISWYEFAIAIKEFLQKECMISPLPASLYPTPAKRPAYSAFDNTKIRLQFDLRIPEWKDSLKKCVAKIIESN